MQIPPWYRALTIQWLPPRLRNDFGFSESPGDRESLARSRRRIARLYARLPKGLRFVGPWHEAQARMACRPLGPIALISNRFWIGQTRLPFSAES